MNHPNSKEMSGAELEKLDGIVAQNEEDDQGVGVITAPEKPKLAKPPLWKVVLLNDDYTPMEFVVEILQIFFWYDGGESNPNYACRPSHR